MLIQLINLVESVTYFEGNVSNSVLNVSGVVDVNGHVMSLFSGQSSHLDELCFIAIFIRGFPKGFCGTVHERIDHRRSGRCRDLEVRRDVLQHLNTDTARINLALEDAINGNDVMFAPEKDHQ